MTRDEMRLARLRALRAGLRGSDAIRTVHIEALDEAIAERSAEGAVRAERNDALQSTIDRLTTINQRLEAEITAVRAERAQGETIGMFRDVATLCAEHEAALLKLGQKCGECGHCFSAWDLASEDINAWGHPCHQPNLPPGTPCESYRMRVVDVLDQARPVSGDHNGSVSGGVGVGPIDCQPAADLRRAGTDRDDAGHAPEVEVATPPAGTRERIIAAARNTVGPKNLAALDEVDDLIALAAACEVLMILLERCQDKRWWTIGADDALRELKAELTPSEDRS